MSCTSAGSISSSKSLSSMEVMLGKTVNLPSPDVHPHDFHVPIINTSSSTYRPLHNTFNITILITVTATQKVFPICLSPNCLVKSNLSHSLPEFWYLIIMSKKIITLVLPNFAILMHVINSVAQTRTHLSLHAAHIY